MNEEMIMQEELTEEQQAEQLSELPRSEETSSRTFRTKAETHTQKLSLM